MENHVYLMAPGRLSISARKSITLIMVSTIELTFFAVNEGNVQRVAMAIASKVEAHWRAKKKASVKYDKRAWNSHTKLN